MGSVADVNVSEAGSEASDSPSWIDPRSEAGYPREESGESWPDSGSDGSEDRAVTVREGFDGIQEIRCGCGKNDSGDGLKIEQFEESPGIEGDADLEAAGQKNESEAVESAWKKPDEVKRSRSVVWWKVPFDFLKYGVVFRSSPIWNFSVAAAAALGLAFLGQRLMYKMMVNKKKKKKVKNLELNITVDDKKVSQFMSGTTRLSEAFSMVKRVPVIRSQLPAAAVIPWPIIALV
ncbi:unnamed protein product [Cuscuta epithymum]|uniref:DUF6821 domain-containing protein n=1 Tax=Cuscuta epithymum TaxID=186058 RepID=A0AAV0DZQ6_9ASTE|nr:unnamed protein product [Cuscuta epithymum]